MTPDGARPPIRVVVFSGGPLLDRGVKRFCQRLEAHPDIALLAIICQSPRPTLGAAAGDLWRRRRWLALPLFLLLLGRRLADYVGDPRAEAQLRWVMHALAPRLHYVPDIHAPDVLSLVRDLTPDLGLIYGSPILRPALFELPRYGTMGIHHGKVPEYRGKKTMFWAMYNGEAAAGVTIQKVNADLDSGQIVREGAVPIGARSQRVVWNELEQLGLALYIEAILAVRTGTAVYRPQVGPRAKLYRDPRFRDVLALWRRQWQARLGVGRPAVKEKQL
jgi:hypothetical protein